MVSKSRGALYAPRKFFLYLYVLLLIDRLQVKNIREYFFFFGHRENVQKVKQESKASKAITRGQVEVVPVWPE